MTTIQEQYVSAVRQSQETWASVVETFTDNLSKSFPLPATPFTGVDPAAAVDQVFDFWAKSLEVQRDIAKQFAGVSVAVAEQVREQAESFSNAAREQAESVGNAVHEQAESVEEAVREQAAHRYEELTKVELQEELAARGLPKTGNVDELRERLVADDQK